MPKGKGTYGSKVGRPKKKKRPETKAKPVIPGERKSERSRKGHTANMV